MAKLNVFSIIKDLSYEKKRLIDIDPNNIKLVKQFLINRGFSYGIDTVLYANEMNKAIGISDRMFYDYYFHALRPRKRFNKWLKQDKTEFIDDVMEYFNYNYSRAAETLRLLTMEQLKQIRQTLSKGGRK
jgi:hypothetical protein